MFKFIPIPQGSSICLRCQYRLIARQEIPSGGRYHSGHRQHFRRFTSGPTLGQEQSHSQDAATNDGGLDRVPIRYCSEGDAPSQSHRYKDEPYTKESLGLDTLGEPAKVLLLGDERNRNKYGSNMAELRAEGPDRNPVQVPRSSSEMLEQIDAERGIVDIDDVCENIENVRRSWARKTEGNITGPAYHDLVSTLHKGFTKPQLAAYLTRAAKDSAADDFDPSAEVSNSLYARSSWHYFGNTPIPQSKAPRIAHPTAEKDLQNAEHPGKASKEGLTKDVLVQRLLRHCWNIVPKFQGSLSGELDMRVQWLHLQLILNHKRDILKLISRSYDCKVEAWPQDRIIRITSDYDTCVDVLKLLVHTLENVKSSVVDIDVKSLSELSSAPYWKKLNDDVLRQIESYTDTIVRPQGSTRSAFHVLYLGPDDADLLEARRLMHQILGPTSANPSKLACSKLKLPNVVPMPVDVGTRLSMLVRNQQWSRWRQAQTKHPTLAKEKKRREEEVEEEEEWDEPHLSGLLERPTSQAMHGEAAFNAVKQAQTKHPTMAKGKKRKGNKREEEDEPQLSSLSERPTSQAMHGEAAFNAVRSFFEAPDDTSFKLCRNDNPHWTSEIEYHDSAKLGLVLLPTRAVGTAASKIERTQQTHKGKMEADLKPLRTKHISLNCSHMPREFVHLVPGLVRSFEKLGAPEKSEEFLQIRLSPSARNKSLQSLPVSVEALPDLEIRIALNQEEQTTSVKDVRLVHAREKDFLQPQHVADLRFTRQQCVYAREDNVDPNIASFVQACNLDIWGTERLKTPVGLSLSIPALAIKPHNKFDPTLHESLPVDYTSFGLEHRTSFTMAYQEADSWPTLTYTDVEGGRIGGQRDELCLHNLRFASRQLPPAGPDSAADIGVEKETLSHDDHTDILLQKTASLIAIIESAGRDAPLPTGRLGREDRTPAAAAALQQPPVLRRWRPVTPKLETRQRLVRFKRARPSEYDGDRSSDLLDRQPPRVMVDRLSRDVRPGRDASRLRLG